MPQALKNCLNSGGDTTLMVWADCDDDCDNADALREIFWQEAKRQAITPEQFANIVFIFAKDRLENWVQFLRTGKTDEKIEASRLKHGREAREAARKLAGLCRDGKPVVDMPASLLWSCANWRSFTRRMR